MIFADHPYVDENQQKQHFDYKKAVQDQKKAVEAAREKAIADKKIFSKNLRQKKICEL